MEFVWFCVIGLLAGWLAGMLTKGGGFGILGNLLVGLVGALLGGALFRELGLHSTSRLGALITATVGAVVLLALLSVVGKLRKRG